MILIAINAATTHLHGPGVRRHVQSALRVGASQAEILELIELTTIMGIHSINFGVRHGDRPDHTRQFSRQKVKAACRPAAAIDASFVGLDRPGGNSLTKFVDASI